MPFLSHAGPYFTAISQFVNSPVFVWGWCGFTLLYACRWALRLYWQGRLIKGSLKEGCKILDAAKGEGLALSEIDARMLKLSHLRQAWQQYYPNLLSLPGEELAGPLGDAVAAEQAPVQGLRGKAGFEIKAVRSPEEYFHEQSLIQPYLDMQSLVMIPTHLSVLGILGTFCGLASGVYLARSGLAGASLDEIQNGLSNLLRGTSLGFWTSIAGIAAAFSFSKLERRFIHSIQKLIANFNNLLLKRFECVSMEHLSSRQLQQSMLQNKQMDKMLEALKAIYRDQAYSNEKVLRQVVKDFHEAMTSSAGQEIKYIAAAFKEIHLGMKESKEALQGSSKVFLEAFEVGSKTFKKNLHEFTHQFQATFHQSNDTLQKTCSEVAKELSATLRTSSSEMSEAFKKPIKDLQDSLKILNQQIQRSSQLWVEASDQSAQHSKKVMLAHAKMSEFIGPLVDAAHAIAQACTQAQASLQQSNASAERISGAVKQMDGINRHLQQSWQAYCKRFEGVDQSLHLIFQQTTSSLHQYTDKVKEFTTDLDQHLSKGMLTLAGAVGELQHVMGALPEAVKGAKPEPSLREDKPTVHYPSARHL